MHVDRCHRSSPCSMTPSPSVDPRPQGRVRMQGGTIDLYRQGNRITRRRRTGALEDDCTAAHSHTCIHHMCVALSSQPPAVRWVVRNIFTYIYIYIYIYMHHHTPQDSASRWSAAPSPATCIQLRVLSGCRGSEVILVVWRRSPHLHGCPFIACVSARICTAAHQ